VPRTNIVNDVKGDMVADSHIILAEWRNHGVNDVRQTKICTAEPLAPEPSKCL